MHTIAIITYDISPYRGSEASVSWNYVRNMRHTNKLIVVYGRGKEEIERFISENGTVDNVEFINNPVEKLTGGGIVMDIKYNLAYRRWHLKTYDMVKGMVRKGEVDLIHYLNPIGFKEPGYCWKINSVPYVWGPIQGVENRPIELYSALSLKGKVNALTRRMVHNGLFILMPRLKKALKRADAVFAATPNTVKNLMKWYGKESIYLPENGIMKMERKTPVCYNGSTLRLIWIGAVNERKALVILLDALSHVRAENWHLDVLGDGDKRLKLQEKFSTLNQNITWHGMVDRTSVQEVLLQSHLHVISSLGEGNPTILWEAFGKAIPTLTLDHCGMAGVVCEKCGIKIPIHSYKQVVSDIASKIEDILEHPSIIENLSSGALECSKKFMWGNRIGLYNETYDRLIESHKV